MKYYISFVESDDTGIQDNTLVVIEADTKEEVLIRWFKECWLRDKESAIDEWVKRTSEELEREVSVGNYNDVLEWIDLFEESVLFIFDEALNQVLAVGDNTYMEECN